MTDIKKIYLDMDGVLCDFEKRYEELFDMTPGESRDRKEFSTNWTEFVSKAQFATLDFFPGYDMLMSYIKSLPSEVVVEILSSSGGEKYHSEVAQQKITWLCNAGIPYFANIVPGRSHKKAYARSDTVLIDDTPDVIKAFNSAGGIGILHENVEETIAQLQELFGDIHA